MNPILAAFLGMLGPGKPPGPGKPLPAFITDTLFQIAGGPFPVKFSDAPPPQRGNYVFPGYTEFSPTDTLTTIHNWGTTPRKREHIAAHETGHVVDARKIAQDALGDAFARQDPHMTGYFADPTEYVAEAFANAVESGRHGFADSTDVDKKMPGVLNIIHWLQTRPPFKK